MPNYKFYHTNHPDGTAHGGTGILIKNNIKHYETNPYRENHIQATSIVVQDWNTPLTLSAVYCPPRYSIKNQQFQVFLCSLGARFLAGGDYNAKHTNWGSRLTTPRGRELQLAVDNNHFNIISTGEPTYWPSDVNKLPDLIDFCVTRGISNNYIHCESSTELSSDHSPVIITLTSQIQTKLKPCRLHNNNTDWLMFRRLVASYLDLNVSLKTGTEITEAAEHFTSCVQQAAWEATPVYPDKQQNFTCSSSIRDKIAEKRKIRKLWHRTRCPQVKRRLNAAVREIKTLLQTEKNEGIEKYLMNLVCGWVENVSKAA
jgi:hypothetical protein